MLTPSVSTFANYTNAILNGNRTHVQLVAVGQNITFKDTDIELNGGVTLQTYLNGDVDLTFGRAVKSELVVHLFRNSKTESIQWSGEFQFKMGVEISGTLASTEWVTVGTFYGKRPDRYEQDNVIEFHLYDVMSKLEVPFDDYAKTLDLTNPITVSDLYGGICTYCGVTKVSGNELANIMSRSYTGVLPIGNNGLTCREVLALIAEACGCYARATNDGKIKMVWYANHMDDYTVSSDNEFDIHVVELDFISNNSLRKKWQDLESYTWEALSDYLWGELEGNETPFRIKALNVRLMQDDKGVVIPANASNNVYIIVDNHFLATNDSTEETTYLTPIYNRLTAFGSYIPMNVTCVGNWLIETGDIITVEVGRNNMVKLPIFTRELKWTGSTVDTYEATGNLERESISPYVNEKMVSGGRMHIVQETVEKYYREISEETNEKIANKSDIFYSQYNPANATSYSASSTYPQGQFCTNDNKLWICITPIATAEAWNEDHWCEIKAGTIWVDTSLDAQNNQKNLWYKYNGSTWDSVNDGTVIKKTSTLQTADSIVNEAVSQAGTAADNSYIKKTTTLQTADNIVSEAVSQSATAAGNTYIAKTSSLQTADSIVNEAVSQAATSAGNNYIAKTTTYQDAASIVTAANGYTNGQLANYSTTSQTSTMISQYVTNNAYSLVSGIVINANGITMQGAQYISLNSGSVKIGSFEFSNYRGFYWGSYDDPNNPSSTYRFGRLSHYVNGGNHEWRLDTSNMDLVFDCSGTGDRMDFFADNFNFQPSGSGMFQIRRNSINQPVVWWTEHEAACCGDDTNAWRQVWSKWMYSDSYNNRSSREVKKNITPIADCGDVLDELAPVTFIYKKDTENIVHSGLIYEDTIDILPQICHDDGKTKSIDYTDLVPYLLKEIQSLRSRVAELEK